MAQLEFDVGGTVYTTDLLEEEVPESVAALRDLLPIESEPSLLPKRVENALPEHHGTITFCMI